VIHDVLRVAFAVVGVIAMTYQFTRLQVVPTFRPSNFFSFFTIQSNILAATILVLASIVRSSERSYVPRCHPSGGNFAGNILGRLGVRR
jgi:hypothetical protein